MSEMDQKGEEALGPLRSLIPILLQSGPAELATHRAALQTLATDSQSALTRQIGFAAVATADRSIELALKQAETNTAQLTDLLKSVPLLLDSSLSTAAYGKAEALLQAADPAELRHAAIVALGSIPRHETETFEKLASLVEAGTERAVCISSLQRLPKTAWSKNSAATLTSTLIEYLKGVPAEQRTEADFINAIQFATELASLLPDEKARELTRNLRSLGPAVFVLKAIYEQMRYDKQFLVVEPGKSVAITLQNDDAMPHNLAILAPNSLEEIGNAAEKMAAQPDSEGRLYVPASSKVIHATKLVPPGQKLQLAFTAPSEPAEYPYVCTFPGHWRRMSGTLLVVKDVDAWLATHKESDQPKITEWRLEDLASDLSKVESGRNLQNGSALFTQLSCIQCHKLGTLGYGFGPDLTEVFARYKKDHATLLQQILEPSRIIEDRYRNFDFDLSNADPVTGMILKEDSTTVIIQTGPADSLVQTLKKSDIQARRPQKSSPMPVGLLNSLSKEQIFDLLAFVESGGATPQHVHSH
jgi:putative heme-binding domain-containing protein